MRLSKPPTSCLEQINERNPAAHCAAGLMITMMEQRQLGKITALLADLGLEVTYAYDDLVFVQHSAFILQFTDIPAQLKLFINTECDPAEANDTASNIILSFDKAGFIVMPVGRFFLTPNEDQTLNIEFR